jgi:hypothetical protein
MVRAGLVRLLSAPALGGWKALLLGILLVAIPTLVRLATEGTVTGCEFTPYLPFVLISAILLRSWQAGAVALASVAIMGGLFVGPPGPLFDAVCFASAAMIFLASSAAIIGIALLVRRTISALQKRGRDSSGGVIFSLERGEVWASWHGQDLPVRLGSQKRVSEMMKDFLAHSEDDSGLPRRFW